ncbi:MAG: DUF4931 domain-containing protein [Anaerotignum sp.]
MSELRKNPFTGEWTLYAENRKKRPNDFLHKVELVEKGKENCPFCGGHEDKTTPALYQDGQDDNWQIRVFSNMFPAVSQSAKALEQDSFYEQVAGRGMHEVLVDTSSHEATIDQFLPEQVAEIFRVLQERYANMLKEDTVKYIQIFKNCGPSAGMSIRHSHWQIMGLPVVPQRVEAMKVHMKEADCFFCKMLEYEKKENIRIVGENESFLAITPYASRFPYEVWVCPKGHSSSFVNVTEKERSELSILLQEILQNVCLIRKDVGYNICLIDAAVGEDFHWHIEILPRIGGFAGFEYATGCYINPILPEQAATYYREKDE